ncbi:hypothetical protein PVAND_013139 [Polypedilum vanderplanki]|uniref:F-box domain-containing protein n=1 Tax=Polypedilum vanderplanki TaxID=319348 RepID=A0A9J6CQJ2_POLVA|nr:hypothetical protein PVAND_013139 [Polypedilum vanderplanki]
MISILDLNQDCLNNIFQYFSIYELIDIEDTCNAFKTTCEFVYKSKKFHMLRIELRFLRCEYFEAIFDRIGSTIKELQFSGGNHMDKHLKESLIDVINDHCIKLSKLTINYVQFDHDSFIKLEKCFHNLTYLDLSRCSINENELKHCLDGEKLKSIQTLKLAGNTLLNGSFFKDMRHIRVLDVSYCFNLLYFHFFTFIKNNCNQLRELDATGSCQLIPEDENILMDLLKYQPYLEKIVMDNVGLQKDDEILSQFKNLKHSSFAGRRFGT